jgi:hypothetical protein
MMMQIPMMKNLHNIELKEYQLWPKYRITHMMMQITEKSKLIMTSFTLVKKQKPQNFQEILKKLNLIKFRKQLVWPK